MRGRVALGLALAVLAVAGGPAAGGSGGDGQDKQRIDARIAELRAQIEGASAHEGVLTSQLSSLSLELRAAQAQVDEQQGRLSALEARLDIARGRSIAAAAYARQKAAFLRFARRQQAIAEHRLERRFREIYMHGRPDTLSVVLSSTSFSQVLERMQYVRQIARHDWRIELLARQERAAATRARRQADAASAAAAASARELGRATDAARSVRDRLAASRDTVAAARNVKADALATTHEDKQSYLAEVRGLEAQSAALAARIRAAQAAASGFAPPDGTPGRLAWPVSGPVTSGFGIRWGRMHEGIDIAVPYKTPVHAAGAGRVVYAGWMSGYGNLVVLDHGGGLSTAYGHNTSIAVGVGQDVAAGQVIAYSGSTGHSTGPHVHFEVRVDGAAVDPFGYL
jgi:murein DD-endopeptidase MepM/ murein hydrolase activator NlpD